MFQIHIGDLLGQGVGISGFLTEIIDNGDYKTAIFESALRVLIN